MMKRIFIFIICAFLTWGLQAQSFSFDQKKEILENVDFTLEAFIQTASLSDYSKKELSEEKIISFTDLFSENAQIDNRYLPPLDSASGQPHYLDHQATAIPIATYMEQLQAYYPQGLSTLSIQNINADYGKLDLGTIEIYFEQRFRATTRTEYTLFAKDFFVMKLQIVPGRDVEITSIRFLKGSLQCENCDTDGDSVMDLDDACVLEPGPPSNAGCPLPPPNDIYITGGVWGKMSGFNEKGFFATYPNIATLLSQGTYTLDGSVQGVGLEASIFPRFFKNKKWGIGTGFWLQQISHNFSAENVSFEYLTNQAFNGKNLDYLKIVGLNNASESQTTWDLSIPIVVKFLQNPSVDKRIGYFADLGIVFSLTSLSHILSVDANLQHEAIYTLDMPLGSNRDWLITEEAVTRNTKEVENYFQQRQNEGLDVALDDQITFEVQDAPPPLQMHGFLRAGVSLTVTPQFQVLVGGQFTHELFSPDPQLETYIISDRVGTYEAILPVGTSYFRWNGGLYMGVMKRI